MPPPLLLTHCLSVTTLDFRILVLSIKESQDHTIALMRSLAKTHKCVFAGSIPNNTPNGYTNRMCFVDASGVIDYYDKIHLFTPAGEASEYSAGNMIKDIRLGSIKVRPLICYDLRFPYAAYNTTNYDIVSFCANWPVARIEQWKTLLSARAIENQSYCIGVNRIGKDANDYHYNGHSRVVDYQGNVILNCGDKEGLFTVKLDLEAMQKYRAKLPFLQDQKRLNT